MDVIQQTQSSNEKLFYLKSWATAKLDVFRESAEDDERLLETELGFRARQAILIRLTEKIVLWELMTTSAYLLRLFDFNYDDLRDELNARSSSRNYSLLIKKIRRRNSYYRREILGPLLLAKFDGSRPRGCETCLRK